MSARSRAAAVARGWWPRLAALTVLVVLGVLVARHGLPRPQQLADDGATGIAAYVVVYAIASLLPVPKAVFTLEAGVLFGVAAGVPIVLAGATLGALLAFGTSRLLGRAPFAQISGETVAALDARLARGGFWAVLGLRLVPVVPFTVLNYAAGLTAVRARAFTAATVVGMAPATSLYVALGAAGRRPGSAPFWLAAASVVVFSVAVVLARRRRVSASAGRPPDDR